MDDRYLLKKLFNNKDINGIYISFIGQNLDTKPQWYPASNPLRLWE
jgi:hypothetical protein